MSGYLFRLSLTIATMGFAGAVLHINSVARVAVLVAVYVSALAVGWAAGADYQAGYQRRKR